MHRRKYLTSVATTLAIGAAGCISQTPTDDTAETDPGAESNPTPTHLPGTPRTPTHEKRAKGEPVSIVRSVTDDPGFDDEIEYYPSNQTIRYVEVRSDGDPVSFGTSSFEEWGEIETTEIAQKKARSVTVERLEEDEVSELSASLSAPPDSAGANAPVARLLLHIDQDPTVSISDVRTVAPRSVQVTVSIGGDTYSRIVPVFVETMSVSTLEPLTVTVGTPANTTTD